MKRFIPILLTTLSLTGCLGVLLTPSYTPEIHWKEEVKLHDGRVIVVERWEKRKGRAEPGQPPMQSWEEIRAKNPDTGEEIVWQEDAASGLEILDFINGVPYLAVSVDSFPSCSKYHFPKINFAFFKYEQRWRRISQKEFADSLDTNLFLGSWHAEKIGMLDSYMTLDKKAAYYKKRSITATLSMRARMEKNKYSSCVRFSASPEYLNKDKKPN